MHLSFLSSIKFRLALLVAVSLVPTSLLTVALLWYDYIQEREQLVASSITTARTVAYAVDQEFISTEATLQALGTSPSLKTAELAAFYDQASLIVAKGIVHNIVLSEPRGKQLVNTLRPFGTVLPTDQDQTRLRLLDSTNGPIISPLFTGDITKKPTIAVSVPVTIASNHVFNLAAGLHPENLVKILNRQQFPSEWIVAIIDSNGNFVARSHEVNRFLGKRAAAGLLEAMTYDNEGIVETTTSEGVAVFGSFSRSAVSNWTVAIGIPAKNLTGALERKLGLLALAVMALLGMSLAVAGLISSQIAQSIRNLRGPALALGLGKPLDIPPLHLKEAEELANSLRQASAMLNKAQHQATHDVLTGLPNRMLFNELVNRQIAVCEKSEIQFSVMYIDLDGFKPVNDLHGHATGDMLLCEVATRLRAKIRSADMAARLGGDEFAVILVGTPLDKAQEVAYSLIDALSVPYHLSGIVVHISASIGLASFPQCGTHDHELISAADMAMYSAKSKGKNQVVCAKPLNGMA